MPITVSADGQSVVTTKSEGKAVSTIPDVCKIPTPNGPVPIPFMNSAESKDVKGGSIMTKIDGGSVALMGSYCDKSSGDEAGSVGGVVSGKTKGKAIFMAFSSTVQVEGRPVCRKGDMMIMNECNTIGMTGMNQDDVSGADPIEQEQVELKPFKVKLMDGDEPRANLPFKLVARNKKVEGSTDSDGIIEAEIPEGCDSLKILVNNEELIDFQLNKCSFNEKGEMQTILSNQGLYSGRIDGLIRSKTRAAVSGFQFANDLKIDSDPGPITKDELNKQAKE